MLCCRFVTRAELEKLGMAHLIGSSLLRAYMHGFFVHNKLYQKARAITEPTDFSTLRKQRIQSKLDEAREQRITLKRKLPKVTCFFFSCPLVQIFLSRVTSCV